MKTIKVMVSSPPDKWVGQYGNVIFVILILAAGETITMNPNWLPKTELDQRIADAMEDVK